MEPHKTCTNTTRAWIGGRTLAARSVWQKIHIVDATSAVDEQPGQTKSEPGNGGPAGGRTHQNTLRTVTGRPLKPSRKRTDDIHPRRRAKAPERTLSPLWTESGGDEYRRGKKDIFAHGKGTGCEEAWKHRSAEMVCGPDDMRAALPISNSGTIHARGKAQSKTRGKRRRDHREASGDASVQFDGIVADRDQVPRGINADRDARRGKLRTMGKTHQDYETISGLFYTGRGAQYRGRFTRPEGAVMV